MRYALWLSIFLSALPCPAQQPPRKPAKPAPAGLTAAQIVDRSVEATGSRAAIEKMSSTWAKGKIEFTAQEARGIMELYAKAPDRRLVIMTIETVGEVRQGFDGHVAWAQDPSGQIFELTGTSLDDTKRTSIFNAPLKWREIYPHAQRIADAIIGGRKAYGVKLTTAAGATTTRYFDAENFLLLRESGRRETPQGSMDITADFSDYREVDGVKAPFQIRQKLPAGEIVMRVSEMKNNIEIDDAQFAKPAGK